MVVGAIKHRERNSVHFKRIVLSCVVNHQKPLVPKKFLRPVQYLDNKDVVYVLCYCCVM